MKTIALSIKIAQKPHRIGSLGPTALKYKSFEGVRVGVSLGTLWVYVPK